MKKSITIYIEDDVAVKHLHRIWSMLHMYCKYMVMFQEIDQVYKIYIVDETTPSWGGVRLSAEISTLKNQDLKHFYVLKRHCSALGAESVNIINHAN